MQDFLLEKGLQWLLNEPTHTLSLEEGRGVFPFNYSFKKVSIQDQKGIWFLLKNGSFAMDSLWSLRAISADALSISRKPVMYHMQEISWGKIWEICMLRDYIQDFHVRKIDILNIQKTSLHLSRCTLKINNGPYQLRIHPDTTWTMSAPSFALQGKGITDCHAHTLSYGDIHFTFQPLTKKLFATSGNIQGECTLKSFEEIENILVKWKDFHLKGRWNDGFQGRIGWQDRDFECFFKWPSLIEIHRLYGHTFSLDINREIARWQDYKMLFVNHQIKLLSPQGLLVNGKWNTKGFQGKILGVETILTIAPWTLKGSLPRFQYGPLQIREMSLTKEQMLIQKLTLGSLKLSPLKIAFGKDIVVTAPQLRARFDLGGLHELMIPSHKWTWKTPLLKIGKGRIVHKDGLFFHNVPLNYLLFLPKTFPPCGVVNGYIKKNTGSLILKDTLSVEWTEEGFVIKAYPNFVLKGFFDGKFIARGMLDLSKLPFKYDIQGKVIFDLKGTLEAMHGIVKILKGSYENANNGTIVENITGTLIAKGPWLHLSNAHAKNIKATGKLALQKADLKLFLKNYFPVQTDFMHFKANGDLTLKGPWDDLHIAGKMTLSSGEVLLEGLVTPEIPKLHKDKKRIKEVPMGNNYQLNIDIPQKIKIEGLGLKSLWTGKLQVAGPLLEPYFIGTLHLAEGKLILFGKPMSLQEGRIAYKKIDPNNPHVHLLAKRDVGDIKVYLRIDGAADHPKVTMTSYPAFSEDIVVAHLLFGKDLKSLSPVEGIQLASVLASLQGARGLDFLETLRSRLDFVNIDIQEEATEDPNKKKRFVEISREFGKIKVGIAQEITTGKETRIEAKYPLTPHLSANVGAGSQSNGDVGLEFQWRF